MTGEGAGRDRWLPAALAVSAAYLAFRLLAPLAAPLLAAVLASAALYPLHARLERALPGRPGAAALLSTFLATLAGVLPVGAALWIAAAEAAPAAQALRDLALSLPAGDLRLVLADHADQMAPAVGRSLGYVARGTRSALTFLAVFPAALFLLLRDGRRLSALLLAALPLHPARGQAAAEETLAALAATVQAVLAAAFVQGLLAAAGFWLFEVRFPVLLGLLCGVLSPVPIFGPALLWAPVAARVALAGRPEAAGAMVAYFLLAVGLSDNVARALTLGAKLPVPLPLLVIALVGGLRAFGLSGALLGPLFVALVAAGARALLRPAESGPRAR